jgi:periplasmic divalent cation tolerance protein
VQVIPSNDILIALSTAPDEACAGRLARTLVEEGLAACVNRVPGMTSTYRWQDAVQEDAEVLLVIKTTRARLPALEARLAELHPYELPELIAVEAAAGSAAYLEWVRGGCGR